MRSFIIEYIKRNNNSNDRNDEVNLELHINLWNFKKLETTFDFGFMVDNINKVKNIILYVPFKIKEVEDLGNNIIEKNQILVDAIFNERCETIKFYPKRLKVTKKGNYDTRVEKSGEEESSFILYSLNKDQITLKNYDNYARIELNVETILSEGEKDNGNPELDNKKYYFRIRFFPEKNQITMIKRENEKINIFQDASLRTTEIIDFRVNDLRACPENLREEFLRTPRFVIKKVHYLIMRNSTDEYITIGDSKVKGRLLEKEIWGNYINIEENDMIAYHVKDEKENTFLNLSRFKYPLNVRKRLFLYILVVIILSILSSYIYDILKNIIDKLFLKC